MSLSRSFAVSPACQRRLHRVIDPGIGFCLRQVPFENAKKSVRGSAERSRSDTYTPRVAATVSDSGLAGCDPHAATIATSSRGAVFIADMMPSPVADPPPGFRFVAAVAAAPDRWHLDPPP
jgi:hypothetical protein